MNPQMQCKFSGIKEHRDIDQTVYTDAWKK